MGGENMPCGLCAVRRRTTLNLDQPYWIPLPLESVQVTVEITDLVAEVELRQVYRNPWPLPLEAQYLFPLDEKAAVCSFCADISGRKLHTRVERKGEARERYEDAVADGVAAALLEQKRPDVFLSHVGNIPVGQQATITVKYVTELQMDGMGSGSDFSKANIMLVLPTTVAPRYFPPKHMLDAAREDGFQVVLASDVTYQMDVTVKAQMRSEIRKVTSPSHANNLRILLPPAPGLFHEASGKKPRAGEDKGSSTWNHLVAALDSVKMDADVVVLFQQAEPHKPRVTVEVQGGGALPLLQSGALSGDKFLYPERTPLQSDRGSFEGASKALMLSLVPRFELDSQKVEIWFVVDRSGSMEGSQIANAAEALHLLLRSLPSDSYFNILGFGTSFQELFPGGCVKYNDQSLATATKHVLGLRADLGGTALMPALQHVLSQPEKKGYLRQLFVLTDGQVYNTEEILRVVRGKSGGMRVFSLGIGSSVSRHLVSGLARAGGGTAEFVTAGERMQLKVQRQMKAALQPSLTDVKVEWDWGGNEKNKENDAGVQQRSEGAGSLDAPEKPSKVKEGFKKEMTLLGYRKPLAPDEDEDHQDESLQHIQRVEDALSRKLTLEAPLLIKPLFDGVAFQAYLLLGEGQGIPKAVTVTAQTPDGPLSVRLEVGVGDVVHGSVVHCLAARAVIRDLEEGVGRELSLEGKRGRLGEKGGEGGGGGGGGRRTELVQMEEKEVSDLIARLAIKYSLASRETSFVAVDESGERDEACSGARFVTQVPALQPRGQQYCGIAASPRLHLSNKMQVRSSPRTPIFHGHDMIQTSMGYELPFAGAVRSASAYMCKAAAAAFLPVESSSVDEPPSGALRYSSVSEQAAPQEDSSERNKSPAATLLKELCLLQSSDGSFDLTPSLMKLLCISPYSAQAKGEWMPDGVPKDPSCLGTAMALAVLRMRAKELEEEWELMALKAIKFLQQKGVQDVGSLIDAAGSALTAVN